MKASDMLSKSDLSQVVQIAGEYNVEPELLLAIGWHETQWGRLGTGNMVCIWAMAPMTPARITPLRVG